MKHALIFSAVLLLVFASAAGADEGPISAKTLMFGYQAAGPDQKERIAQRLYDVQQGYMWANGYLEHEGEKLLYCAPSNLALTGSQLISIIDQEIKVRPLDAQFPYAMTLLYALQYAFPCGKKLN